MTASLVMNGLLENPIPVLGVGLVLAGIAGMVFFFRRSLPSLLTLAGVVLATFLLVTLEYCVVTQAEEVEQATRRLVSAVEANDLPAILTQIAPSATGPRTDAERLSKRLKIVKARVGGRLRVELDSRAQPIRATSRFHGLVDGIDRASGIKMVSYNEIQLVWIRQEGGWLLVDYTVMRRGEPVHGA